MIVRRAIHLSLLFFLLPSSALGASAVRTVALSGTQAPGTSSGTNFNFFSDAPVLNDAGQIAFRASLSGSGVDSNNSAGIWSEGSGNLALVARGGSQAPGVPSGVVFNALDWSSASNIGLSLNNAGQVSFWGTLLGPGVDTMHHTNTRGIWSEGSGVLALVAREGDHAPGLPDDITLSSLSAHSLNNAGQIAFPSSFKQSGVAIPGGGIWTNRSGALALVVRDGQQAPGTPSGVNFSSLGSSRPQLNDAGQIAFHAYLNGNGVDGTNWDGIWSEGSGGLALVARAGDHAPGTPSGVNFDRPTPFGLGLNSLNNAGHVAFQSYLSGSGIDATNNEGIWSNRTGSLALVARAGDHAPGTPNGVNFGPSAAFPDVVFALHGLNEAGEAGFSAFLAGMGVDVTNDEGVWIERSGSLTLVALEGDAAPGTPNGVKFGSAIADGFMLQGIPTLNDAGQTAFLASVVGAGVTSTNDSGIWASDRAGILRLVARNGDPLEVAPGDSRTLAWLDLGGLNNLGQVAFLAHFTDGSSGIFVSNAVAVPEPSAVAQCLLALLAILRRLRR